MIKANFNAYATYVTDSLYQWDLNQVLTVTGLNLTVAPEVHFSNALMDKAIVRQSTLSNKVVSVQIPNSLLQAPLTIKAHIGIYEGSTFKVIELVEIPVIAKKRPDDYSISEDDAEIWSFKRLDNKIAQLVNERRYTYDDEELLDIRIDVNGTRHTTAGNAVRAQITSLSEAIDILNQGGLNLKDDVIGEHVNTWLDDHPEATTTVQDGALTEVKFSEELKLHTIKDYVTPQMFGAKGDGITDDTSAFINAIASGKIVYIPSGTYITGAISVDNCCKILGDTHNKPTLKCEGITLNASSQLFGLNILPANNYAGTGVLVNKSGCEIFDCIVSSFNIGVELSSITHIIGGIFKNLTLGYNTHAGIKSVASSNAQKNQIVFDHLYIVNNGINYADDTAESTKLTDGFGMYIDGGYAIEVRNCVFEYNTGVGLYLGQAYPLYGCNVTSPYFEHNKYAQLYLANDGGTYMRNVHISGDFYTDAGRDLPVDAMSNRELCVMNNTRLKNDISYMGNYFSKVSAIANGYANRYCPYNLFPYDIIGEIVNPHLKLGEYDSKTVWSISQGSVRIYGCPIPIEKGDYKITFDIAKNSDEDSTCVFALVGHGDGSKPQTLHATKEWSNVTISMSFTDYGICELYVENGSTYTFYIKNIRIVKV